MRLGIFARTFAGDTPEAVLSAIRDARFEAAAWNLSCSGLPSVTAEIPDGTGAAVAEAARATGIAIVSLSATFNMIHPDPGRRQEGLAALGPMARTARAMGAPLLTLCTGTRDPDDQWRHHPDNIDSAAWRDLRASMDAALEVAEREEVDLGVEPEAGNVVADAGLACRLLEEVRHPRLRIVIDPANLIEAYNLEEQRGVVSAAIDLLGDRIAMAHAKDRAEDGRVAPPGRGVIDWDHYIAELRQVGFDGPIVAHGFDAASASDVAAFLHDRIAGGP